MLSVAEELPKGPLFVPDAVTVGTPSRCSQTLLTCWRNSIAAAGTKPLTGVGLSDPTCVPPASAVKTPTSVEVSAKAGAAQSEPSSSAAASLRAADPTVA